MVKKGFIAKYIQQEVNPNNNYKNLQTNYDEQLTKHEGHQIVITLLFRGANFRDDLKEYYDKQIKAGNELINEIDKFISK